MPQTQALLDTLKSEMRRQGRTYADAAKTLGLSEASVKRIFSEKNLSLARMDRLCQWLGLEISDLVDSMRKRQKLVTEMTWEQEEEFVTDIRMLLVTLRLFNGWTVQDILDQYRLTETEMVQLLARLDRMKVLELLPGNRVRLLISQNFAWIPEGPIQRFFEAQVQSEFFASRFNQPGERRIFITGMLSQASNADITQRMERLAMEFNARKREDERLDISQRFNTSIVMAIRPWEAGVFKAFRKE